MPSASTQRLRGGCQRLGRPRWALDSSLNLAVTRVAVCALVLSSSELWHAAWWTERALTLETPPAGLDWAIELLRAHRHALPLVQAGSAGCLLLALLGVGASVTLPLSALGALVLFALPHLSGGPRHSMHLVWFLAILSVSPAGRAFALRPTRRARARARPSLLRVGASLTTLRLALASVYVFPGLWKLRESGLAWVFSDNLQNQMYAKWLQFGALPGFRIDRHPALVQAGALGVVAFELGFPLMLWTPISRACAAALGLAFHLAADVFLFLPFSSLWGCYAMLLDWGAVARWLGDRPLAERRVTLAQLAQAVRRRTPLALATPRGAAAAVVMALVVAGAWLQGFRGEMQSYPFACYPTFQWRAGPTLPDLWIEVERDGRRTWLPDSPAFGGRRAPAGWAAAWRAAGLYSSEADPPHLTRYVQSLPPDLRRRLRSGDRLRFYRVQVPVAPESDRRKPESRVLLAEIRLDRAALGAAAD